MFLASVVVDHVQDLLKKSTNQGFAFFYCDKNENDRREPLSVLSSLVRQLSTAAGNSGAVRKTLQDLYRSKRSGASELTFDNCRGQLLEAIDLYEKTTLVLDALDECESDPRRYIVETINFLLSNSQKPVRIFVSSRSDRDLRKAFQHLPNFEIEEKIDTELVDLLKEFLGTPKKSSVEYRRWHSDLYTRQWSKTSRCYLSYICKAEISPASSNVLSICRFSFYTLLKDWWNAKDISLSQENEAGESCQRGEQIYL